ncbi:hypothetical protein [Streptomyces sp. NPDC056628]|uniref:hypothetical protein n=1 Tax=Streptomyces sp. NPDC056628 TaxID=3345882 RepID=UPI0036C71765
MNAPTSGPTRARRPQLTLADPGHVHRGGRHFRLTPRVLELGCSCLSSRTGRSFHLPAG